MSKHERWELAQMQSLPLDAKIGMTEYRIREWVEYYGEDGVSVSFSGGKDSTVLLHILRKIYPNVKAVYFDTGLEYPEIRLFVKGYENVDWIKPKMNFREVITKYGYPFISKEVSDCVQGARKYLTSILQSEGSAMELKRSEQKCIYCENTLDKKGCLGMCNKHYIQYKRWGDPLHSDKKERATIDGYYRDGKTGRREHRIIYEKYYGVILTKDEVIHHINFIKTDNRIENLWKYNNASEHIKAHRNYEKLMDSLKPNEEIVFENGSYIKRERESIQTDIIAIPTFLTNSQDKENIQKEIIPSNIAEEKHLQSIIDGKHHYYNYECDRIFETANNDIKEAIKNGNIKANARLKILTGTYPHREKGVETTEYSNMFSQERYKFFLNAPFEISNKCCNIMKKNPSHTYMRETGRKPITAQMASESRLRTQKWLQNGCNAFESKNPISNPMSFWTEQDVLLYIKQNNLHIASVYGDIVTDYAKQGQVENQMNLSDFGIYCQKPVLKTTGCNRTGCMFCGFGLQLEKSPNRFERMAETHPKLLDYVMRGGAFDDDGLWKPDNRGLGYWFVIEWINIHGGLKIEIPNREYYLTEYQTEETKKYLERKG